MDKCIAKLTVCFEAPFWIGIYERECVSMAKSTPNDNNAKFAANYNRASAQKRNRHSNFSKSSKGLNEKNFFEKSVKLKTNANLLCGKRNEKPNTEGTKTAYT